MQILHTDAEISDHHASANLVVAPTGSMLGSIYCTGTNCPLATARTAATEMRNMHVGAVSAVATVQLLEV